MKKSGAAALEQQPEVVSQLETDEAVTACAWHPKEVAGLSGIKITDAACGADHTVTLTEWGAAFAFGDNSMNQLGAGVDGRHDLADMVHLSEE